jgi:hypothetical protein
MTFYRIAPVCSVGPQQTTLLDHKGEGADASHWTLSHENK